MNRVGKVVPPKRQILKDISLSFFPGAKIGVLGLNGSGKSTLLRIMAGVDKDIVGEAAAACRASRSATCRRSRGSIRRKTVREGGARRRAPRMMMVDRIQIARSREPMS
jgi:ATPase subunit of ABC transporter with duplicated ATPase domains